MSQVMNEQYIIIDFSQERHGLGESGLRVTEVLHVYVNAIEVKTYDNYLLVTAYPHEHCWNPRHDRACFVVRKQPPGTFPALDDNFDRFADLFLCVFDIHENDVVKEIPVASAPLRIQWDEAGDFPVPGPDPGITRPESPEESQFEYEVARANMNTMGTIGPDDPINDPTRLEHYLFYYDERYVRGTPYEYATRMRDQYLRSLERPAYKGEPAREPEPAPEPAPTMKPKSSKNKNSARLFICLTVLGVLLILATVTFFRIHF